MIVYLKLLYWLRILRLINILILNMVFDLIHNKLFNLKSDFDKNVCIFGVDNSS